MIILGIIAFFIMGLSLGLLGGGGSILTVPILVYIFKQDPVVSTTNSLFIVGLTAAIGAAQYIYRKQVHLKIVFLFSIPSIIGIYFARKILLPIIPKILITVGTLSITKNFILMISFAIIMLIASFKMIRSNSANPLESKVDYNSIKKKFSVIIKGFIVGAVAGFIGAGGGFLIIPVLTMHFKLKMRIAIGTSLAIIAIQSLTGFLLSTDLKITDWNFLTVQVLVAIIGLIVGLYFSKFAAEQKLKKIFGYFVLVIGFFIFIDQLIRIIRF